MSTSVQQPVQPAHMDQNIKQQEIKPPVQPMDVLSANLASQMFVKEPVDQPSVHVPAITEGFQQLFNSQPQQHYQQAQTQQQFEPGKFLPRTSHLQGLTLLLCF